VKNVLFVKYLLSIPSLPKWSFYVLVMPSTAYRGKASSLSTAAVVIVPTVMPSALADRRGWRGKW